MCIRDRLGAVLLAMALFALLPFVYMGLVSLTQKTVLDLRFCLLYTSRCV